MSPPNFFVISLHICRPNPTPFILNSFVESKNPNSLNNLPLSSFFIPTPESFTEINKNPFYDTKL